MRRDRIALPGVGQILDYARHLGLRRTVVRSAYVAINQVLPLSLFEAMTLRPGDLERDLLVQDALECRLLEPDEMRRFAGGLEGAPGRTLARAAARGDLCAGVLDGDRLVNTALFSSRPTPVPPDLVMSFDPPCWYMYGGWTLTAYRGRRLHARSIARGAQVLFDRGVPALVTVCEKTNYPAIISSLRMGWQPAGGLYRMAVGPWSRFGASAGARALGMHLELRSGGDSILTPSDLAAVLTEERHIMDELAPLYDVSTETNAYVHRLLRERFVSWMTRLASQTGELASMSVLDAGCGTGSLLALLSDAGFGRLTGLDLSLKMLAQARQRALPGTFLLQGTIEDAPLRDRSFDVIVASFSVHHLLDPGAFFRLVDRTLRPGGTFFIQDFDPGSGLLGGAGEGTRRDLGNLVRGVLAWKNRCALASEPAFVLRFNPAHRQLDFAEMRRAMSDEEAYALRQESHGFLLAALLPVLIEESAVDRRIAQLAAAIDRRLARHRPGPFQWIAGRRRD